MEKKFSKLEVKVESLLVTVDGTSDMTSEDDNKGKDQKWTDIVKKKSVDAKLKTISF